jgi:hypothetical protein
MSTGPAIAVPSKLNISIATTMDVGPALTTLQKLLSAVVLVKRGVTKIDAA